MTQAQASAEVFLSAFRALPKGARRLVIARLAEERSVREDLMDLAVFADRESEPSRPFEDFLKERREPKAKP